jgi:rhomboid protease GluP
MSDRPAYNADGTVDYSRYTEEQLFRVLGRIDAEKYPLNFANLKAELAARQIPIDPSADPTDALMAAERLAYLRAPPVKPEIRIAFAPQAGFLTWLGPSRNDFRLVGSGSISIDNSIVTVRGRRFGFILGLPLRRRVAIPMADIANVEREANVVSFESRPEGAKSRSLSLWLETPAAAEKLIKLLPDVKTADFAPQLAAHMDFEYHLENRAPRLPVTYGFAGLCLLMFAVTISHGAAWFGESGLLEIGWGSNFGPATIGGQWWRLLTYSLLHFGVLHFAFNMWALISFGAVAERLYGSYRYAGICLVAGIAGGMFSITLQPQANSAGASAIIFGILGALLVAHLRGEAAIPPSVQRSLRNSTLVFVAVTLISGLVLSGIDNAAHVGGLVAGSCMGLAFHSPRRGVRVAAPGVLALLVAITGASLGMRAGATSTVEARYWESFRWFVARESGAIQTWSALQQLARTHKIGDDALADRIDHELLPFWREASGRFKPLEFATGTKIYESNRYMQIVTQGRFHALELCVSGLHQHDVEIAGACMKEMGRVDEIITERVKTLGN